MEDDDELYKFATNSLKINFTINIDSIKVQRDFFKKKKLSDHYGF